MEANNQKGKIKGRLCHWKNIFKSDISFLVALLSTPVSSTTRWAEFCVASRPASLSDCKTAWIGLRIQTWNSFCDLNENLCLWLWQTKGTNVRDGKSVKKCTDDKTAQKHVFHVIQHYAPKQLKFKVMPWHDVSTVLYDSVFSTVYSAYCF